MVEAHHYQEIFKMVSIPRLKQIQPSSGLPSNDRINLKVRDQSANIQNRTNQLVNLGNTALKVDKAYEDDKIDTLSSEANQNYAEWNVQKLQELKNHKGDPTDVYAQYDLDEKQFFEELRDSRPNLNERVRRGVEGNLAKAQGSTRIKVLKQRGYQKEVFTNTLFESDVKLAKQGLSVSAGYIKKGDRTTSNQFNSELGDIKTLIAKRGMKNGTVTEVEDDGSFDHSYTDADGEEIKVKFSQQSKARVYKDLNEGVVNSIGVLIASDKSDQARNMMEDYDSFIDPKSRAKFEKGLKKTEDNNEASVILNSIRGKTEDEQLRAIDNIKDFDVRSEALKLKQLNTSRRNALVKNQQDKNFDAVHGVVEQLRDSGQLYGDKSIEDNKQIKMILSNHKLSSKQMKALKEEIKSPKTSDDKALDRVTNLFLGGELQKITPAQLTEQMVGLSKGDKSKFRNKYLSRRTESKGGAERTSQIYNRAKTLLTDKMYAEGIVENEDGFLNDSDFVKVKKAKVELLEYLDNAELGDKPSMGVINKHIDEFINLRVKEKAFNFGNFFGTTSSNNNSPSAKKNIANALEGENIFEWQRKYKKERGLNVPPSATDINFLKYVSENK